MSIKSTVDEIIDLTYQLGTDLVIEPTLEFCRLWKLTYLKDKLTALFVLCTVCFVLILSCFLSYKFFIERSSTFTSEVTSGARYTSPKNLLKDPNLSSGMGGVVINGKDSLPQDGKERAVDMYLQSYNGFFEYIGDFFQDYIANTVDPLGHSLTDSSGISFEPVVNKNSKIQFSTGATTFYSAYRYASIFIGIVSPILVLMVVLTGLQVLMTSDNYYSFEKLGQKLTRIAVTVLLIFIGMPLILTGSVMTTNLLNQLILSSGKVTCPSTTEPVTAGSTTNQQGLTCFVQNITQSIKDREIQQADNQPKTVEIDGWDIGTMLKVQGQNFWGFLQILPIILITMFMLILLFVIFIQFVIRYLQIYFLYAIYPIVAVMWYNQSTSKYFSEYWKQLVTLLIQQPVFLLCFVIFGDISQALLQDLQPSNILLFSIYLVFLVSVPQALTARIFGDVFAYQSGQDFSDKMNYAQNKAQSSFTAVKQGGQRLIGSGLKSAPTAVLKTGQLGLAGVTAVARSNPITKIGRATSNFNTSNSQAYSNVQAPSAEQSKTIPSEREKSVEAARKRKSQSQKTRN